MTTTVWVYVSEEDYEGVNEISVFGSLEEAKNAHPALPAWNGPTNNDYWPDGCRISVGPGSYWRSPNVCRQETISPHSIEMGD